MYWTYDSSDIVLILGGEDTASVLAFDPQKGTVSQWRHGNLTRSRVYPVAGRLGKEIIVASDGTSDRFDQQSRQFVPGPRPMVNSFAPAGSIVGW